MHQAKGGESEGEEAKVTKPKKVRTGSDLVETPMAAADFQAAVEALEEAVPNKEYIYAPGRSIHRGTPVVSPSQ